MNGQLAIIMMIDVEAALSARSLDGHAYLIDNNRFMGSTGEGTDKLVTKVVGNQIMNWLVFGIDVSGQQPFPALVDIGGEAVDKQVMVPQLFDSPALDGSRGLWWGATVDARVAGRYGYTLHIRIDGTDLQFASAVDVEPGFTMHVPVSFQQSQRQAATLQAAPSPQAAPARSAASSSRTGASPDPSVANPRNHVSLFSPYHLDILDKRRRELYP